MSWPVVVEFAGLLGPAIFHIAVDLKTAKALALTNPPVRAKQSMDVAELEKTFDELVSLPGFKEGLSLIVDFKGSDTPTTTVELRRLAAYATQTDDKWDNTKWSVLASADVAFGLSRMFMALTNKHQVETHIFRNLDEADDWLGLGVEMVEILEHTPR
jgi:hypothetical protein